MANVRGIDGVGYTNKKDEEEWIREILSNKPIVSSNHTTGGGAPEVPYPASGTPAPVAQPVAPVSQPVASQPTMNGGAPGSSRPTFSYDPAPSYTSKYADKIDAILDRVLTGSYSEFLGGDEYASLEGRYTKQGQKAMRDTVGDVAARTGGLASSYAVTAGQQAYGNYMDELEVMAREMYSDKRADLYQQAQLLQALEEGDYNRYLTLLDQYNRDRSFDYGVFSDDRNFDYQREKDEYERNASIADTMSGIGDFSALSKLGYTDDQIAKLVEAYKPRSYTPGVPNPDSEEEKDEIEEAGDDPTISNRHGNSWIYIPGHGRFSYQEIYKYVQSGKVRETYDEKKNTLSYEWVG